MIPMSRGVVSREGQSHVGQRDEPMDGKGLGRLGKALKWALALEVAQTLLGLDGESCSSGRVGKYFIIFIDVDNFATKHLSSWLSQQFPQMAAYKPGTIYVPRGRPLLSEDYNLGFFIVPICGCLPCLHAAVAQISAISVGTHYLRPRANDQEILRALLARDQASCRVSFLPGALQRFASSGRWPTTTGALLGQLPGLVHFTRAPQRLQACGYRPALLGYKDGFERQIDDAPSAWSMEPKHLSGKRPRPWWVSTLVKTGEKLRLSASPGSCDPAYLALAQRAQRFRTVVGSGHLD